jgi:long-chain acyl-CoA synthetase
MSGLWDTSNIQPNHDVVMPGDTIPAMFWNAVEKRGPNVWMRQKHLGLWRSWTWTQTADAVQEIAAGLMSVGFAKGDCASILANTVVEWVWADLGVLSAGGVSNGIYPTDAASQVQYLSEDSRTTVLFVEDDEQLDKALEVRQQLPLLRKIVVFNMEGLRSLNEPDVMGLNDLRQLGRDYLATHPQAVRERAAALSLPCVATTRWSRKTTVMSGCAFCRFATLPSAWVASTLPCTPVPS